MQGAGTAPDEAVSQSPSKHRAPYLRTAAPLGHTPYLAGGQRVRGTAPEDFFTILWHFPSEIYVPHDLPHLVGKLTLRSARKRGKGG